MRPEFGFRSDFNGLGVFVFKHKDKWRIQSILNQGLSGLTVESAVNNLTTPDNSCMVDSSFEGGNLIYVTIKVDSGKLSVDYRLPHTGATYKCIADKKYQVLKKTGYIGVTSGNPINQNVNEIGIHSIDFFNGNQAFYQHEKEIVGEQTYYKRDESGYMGAAAYPWSAKLNTIEMGKVAFDVLEMKRTNREYRREQFMKSLHIVRKEDDIREVIFKMFE